MRDLLEAGQAREQVTKLVAQVQRADYEGDRAALKRLHGELAKFSDKKDLAAQVEYWRGFALWRRAINGFNDGVDPNELEQNLKEAVAEFKIAAEKQKLIDREKQDQQQRPTDAQKKAGQGARRPQ